MAIRKPLPEPDRNSKIASTPTGQVEGPQSRRIANGNPDSMNLMLKAAAQGDPTAAAELLPLVYEELRRLASARMADTPPGNTLQATALVHEAYLRLVGSAEHGWDGRAHFFGAAARAMRDILVEQARRKDALKHGGNRQRLTLHEAPASASEDSAVDAVALDQAINRLEQQDSRKANIVMLRYFAGLTQAETAAALGLSERTIEREWRYIKAWLHRELSAMQLGNGGGS